MSAYIFGTRHRYISGKPNIDKNLLKELLGNEGQISNVNDDKNCFTFTIPSASQKQKCPILHIIDKRFRQATLIINEKVELLPLVKTGCNIIFHKYELLDLELCPYIVMIVKNTHSHPFLPPHRTPNHLQQDLKSLIENSNDLLIDSTLQRLISGPLIKAVFGVVHAFNQNELNLRDYIQRITFMNDGHIMILSYIWKINELEFNAYDKNNNSVVTFCRIYSNESNAKAYQYIFIAFFEVYEDLTGEKPTFYYFNSENSEKKGWAAIIVDLDKGQAK
ncbi:hypothetical protein C1646_762086, partial [Rhizophagus diaphanus]